ncbi:MAG: hypothetical protein Q4C49_12800 [Bacillota bacterium]|nr:hypothetical protein [Bacillota bacterium]
MKIHYFQRYHQKENVATSNTMLLLSRLYNYSPDKFFRCIKSIMIDTMGDSFDPEIVFNLQTQTKNSVLDATIEQKGFKIGIETKISDWFYKEQLENHLSYFKTKSDDNILITISSERMNKKLKKEFEQSLLEYNKQKDLDIYHVNLTFEELYKEVENVIDSRDYEMIDVLEDYYQCLCDDKLIVGHDSWKVLRAQLSGNSFEFNLENNIYYDKGIKGFRPHKFVGLYKNKSVRAIGEIKAIILCEHYDISNLVIEKFDLPKEYNYKEPIKKAVERIKQRQEIEESKGIRFFILEKFYETDFNKITPNAIMGTKYFDLEKELKEENFNSKITTKQIAEYLSNKSWE